ncbi:class I SAM-dependent methyltransferase [Candidatus Margulisiibacteriota bacterium]
MAHKVNTNMFRGNPAIAAVRRVDLGELKQAAKSMRPGIDSKFTLLRLAMNRVRESLVRVPGYLVTGGGYQAECYPKRGVFLNSGLTELNAVFESIHMSERKMFLDAGSGMGDVVFLAAIYGVKAEGVEFDPELLEISRIIQKKLSSFIPEVKGARLFKGDYSKVNLGKYDTFYHFRNMDNEGLMFEEKFAKEPKPFSLFLIKTKHSPSGFGGGYSAYVEDVSTKMPIPLVSHYGGMFVYMRGSLPFKEPA